MEKAHILAEIRRTAEENGGKPLGRVRFLAETGIRETDWSGKHWVRWSDAVRQAGFEPNELQAAYPDQKLLHQFAELIRELGHYPVTAEVKLKARMDPSFPSHNTFARFGRKADLASRIFEFCIEEGDLADVAEICAPVAESTRDTNREDPALAEIPEGFVYLMKSGRFYKIGRTNSVGRRERELAIQLPEKLRLVHSIKTDDPKGIERYWHDRFAERRKNGEWFELSASDVSAFRRRKFM